MPPTRSALPYLVLAIGVLVVSTASILIRLAQAQGVPSLVIAAVRLGIASIVLLPLALARSGQELRNLRRTDLALALASGALLAIHFWSWIASLAFTSVASSTVLVTTNPLWVGLASFLLFRERLSALAVGGIALCVAGTVLTFTAQSPETGAARDPLLGNLLALLGAISASGYLLIGRAVRRRLSLLAYIALAYGTAAVFLALAVAITATGMSGFPVAAWVCMLLLALGPQLIGHTTFNWSLRRMSATFVALAILGEPVGSAILAWLLFAEHFTPAQFVGFVLLLAGIFLAAASEKPQSGD